MTDWNYADVWEIVADVQPTAVAVTQGGRNVTVGRVRPRGGRRGAVPARPRRRPAGQGGGVPVQLAGVHPGHVRRHEGRAGAGQHQLPLRGRRAQLPVGQRRRRGGRLPRHVHRAGRAHPRPRPRREGLAVGRRRLGPVPGLGDPVRGRRQVGHRPRRRTVGPQRGRPLHALHRRHDRDAQGRHVAAGRSVRAAHRRRRAPLRRQRRARGRARRARDEPGRGDAHAGLPADARDGRLHRQHGAGRGRPGVPARGPQVRPGRDARHHREGEGQRRGDRGRPLLAAPARRARRASREVGPELGHDDDLVGCDVERAGEGAAALPPRRHAPRRRVQLLGGARHGRVRLGRRRGGQDGVVHARARREGADRGRAPGRPRVRRGGRAGARPGATRSGTTRTRRSRSARSRRSTACATPSRATTPRSTPTAPSTCWAGARCASTRGARRSSPRRWRRRSRPTTPCTTPSWSASRTPPTASRSWPSSSRSRAHRSRARPS